MRNDKGFTFVELIAVLVIIVILFIVSFPPIMKALKNTQIKIDNGVMQIIEDGTNDLLVDETSAYDNKDTNKYCIKINDLIKKGYVSEEIAKDINKDAYSVVTFEKNKPKIEIHTECIEEINDLYFALNGNKEININLGSTYSDSGVIAYDKNGNSLINNVNINIMDEKLVTQDSVDTSKVGTYIIEYYLIHETKYLTLERTVNVISDGNPIITHPGDATIEITVESYNIIEGVSAVDVHGNNVEVVAKTNLALGLEGNYIITYIATDKSGNTTVSNRLIRVKDLYKEKILNGAYPELVDNLIPITIDNDGTVRKADIYDKWYCYEDKWWANAVILTNNGVVESDGTIRENYIESYFVWVPRYKYLLFDLGNYDGTIDGQVTTNKAKKIEIIFENKDDTISDGDEVDEYLSHPAFQAFDTNGLWVGKFETTGNTSNVTIKPGEISIRGINASTMFTTALNYKTIYTSHMMKNTEWGAVAYLSHSKYGINKEININNHTLYYTGYSAVIGTNQSDYPGTIGTSSDITQPYNTETGYLASTTGNITGIYDMAGGSRDVVAAFCSGNYSQSGFTTNPVDTYGTQYFDIYPSNSSATYYINRKLGDATGEMGPFYLYKDGDNTIRKHNSWYNDTSDFVHESLWFSRGGYNANGILASQFYFLAAPSNGNSENGFRIVLATKKE